MASENPKPIMVGVLMDPKFGFVKFAEPDKSVDETINSAWTSILKSVDPSLTLETVDRPKTAEVFAS
jgi:hypothetical protein